MPTVKFSKKSLLESLGRKISDQELQNRINFLGTNFEGMVDDELSIEVFPNRPDLLSEQGMARALRSFLNIKTGFKQYVVKKSNVKVIVDKSVKNVRPFTACAIVKNLKLTEEKIKEIIQIQEKLHITYGRNRKKAAIGIYPLEHIKPPIFYKALHPEEIKFKPLDMNKDLTGPQVLAIHPTGREYGFLLEGLEKWPIFIDSKMNIMSMPPIINSNNVGKISVQTRDVFIECSGFDFDYLHTCLNIIVTSLADIGGEINSVEIQYPDKKRTTPLLDGRDMKLDVDYVNKILGLELKENDLKFLLEKMGHGHRSRKAIIPGYRADILHPIDLIEDIAIAYGYENFESKISNAATVGAEKPIEVFNNKVRDILIGLGLIEVKNVHLTNKDYQCKLMNFNVELVELDNSVNQDFNVLRYWMIPSVLETLRNNKHYEYPQNIFEIGNVFKINPQFETKVQESERLVIALCGNDVNYTKIKQYLDALMESMDLKYQVVDSDHTSFIKGRVGRVSVNEEKIAFIGEIHPQILMNWSLEMPVAALELNLTDLFRIMHFPSDVKLEKHDKHKDHAEKKQKHSEKKHEKHKVKKHTEKKHAKHATKKHSAKKHTPKKAHKPKSPKKRKK
ncbi:TPA: phenylalanine--tRNA ligase subunit beta [Candidatus Woesearchaeota archaeon]|nr:phenylalanine--tRNA ligase subunit beta [Candidatus Woesearchaeota archaeon]HIJ14511.1 phenylalanine--tRNA ligase subunit beta [Candidatus Woesearchaeota archaeon]